MPLTGAAVPQPSLGISAFAIPDAKNDAAVATVAQTFVKPDMTNPPSLEEILFR
jgi:hypothetical protein